MARRYSHSGPRLPQALQEQIDQQENAGGRLHGTRNLSRREARKDQRHAKKERKANHFSQGRSINDRHTIQQGSLKRAAEDSALETREAKKRKLDVDHGRKSVKKASSDRVTGESVSSTLQLPKTTPLSKLQDRTELVLRTQAEIEEDKRIEQYERLLAKGGGDEDEDGLDDLLAFADRIVEGDGDQEAYEDLDEHSIQHEKNLVGTADGDHEGEDLEKADVGTENDMGDEEASDQGLEAESEESEEFVGFDESEDEELRSPGQQPGPVVSENAPGGAYVPPHLRNQQASQVEGKDNPDVSKLKRQCQGLLNRLSEQNITGILTEIEALYRTSSRNDVTTMITTLILHTISSRSNLLDSFVILYAALVASLTKLMGIEFGANFVYILVTSYKEYHTSLQASGFEPEVAEERGKECMNLITLLSELYNFQVVSCVLIYDVVRGLLEGSLTEFNVELLLKLLKDSGPQLRHDDPMALNDIIAIVQQKTADQDARSLGSRTRFMIETLGNLKSNKSKAVQNQAVAMEATNRMKKVINGLSKTHHIRSHEPLRVSLADLLSAEQKGKWWLVGAAWSGDPRADRPMQSSAEQDASTSKETILRKLAKKQGMNTEVRRNIFLMLLSSEDYVDAQERLDQLSLTELQQREIMRVLLHCCGIEKTYNPFYTLVAQRLCQASHAHKVTLQFCLWDFLRELGETEVGGAEIVKSARAREEDVVAFDVSTTTTRVTNLAKAFAWLVAKGALNLIIFRPVNFSSLQPRTVMFLHTFLIFLILDSQLPAPVVDVTPKLELPKKRNREALEEVVMKAAANATLSKGLNFFISRSPPDTAQYLQTVADAVEWGCDVIKDTLKAGMDLAATLT